MPPHHSRCSLAHAIGVESVLDPPDERLGERGAASGDLIEVDARNGIVPGVKVRQGEIIAYVGATGLASGPHLHYEVLINSRFVDPLGIQVPRERELTGRQLADFQKERARIDDLRHLSPVLTASK